MDANDPRVFVGKRSMLERKPAHGAPCTRCGLCCVATICPLGRAVFKRSEGPCPALEQVEPHVYACGLVANPANYAKHVTDACGPLVASAAAGMLVGSGDGCDARFNGEPINYAFYIKLAQLDKVNASHAAQAKRIWNA